MKKVNWNDPWNRLDFSIVVLGLVTELPFVSGVNFSAFRAFRALRALRTMKYAQGLRQIVDTFIETHALRVVGSTTANNLNLRL